MRTHHDTSLTFNLFVVLFFLALVFLYLFGLDATSVFDTQEAYTAQASLESNQKHRPLFAPVFQGVATVGLGPLVTALQQFSIKGFGAHIFALRLPSVSVGILAVFIFYNGLWLLTRNRRFAFFAALVLGLSGGVFFFARFATMHMLFFFFTLTSTLMLIGNIYADTRSTVRGIVAGLLMGFGFLSGGILAYVLPFLTAGCFALCKDHRGYNLRTLAPLQTFLASLPSLLPWGVIMYHTSGLEAVKQAGLGLLQGFSFTEGVPALSVVMIVLMALPWVLFLPFALKSVVPTFFVALRGYDARKGLPAFAVIWLIVDGVLAAIFGVGATLDGLWFLPPLALLVAHFFDGLPEYPLSSLEFAFNTVLWCTLAALFFALPAAPHMALGTPPYEAFSAFLGQWFPVPVEGAFFKDVLQIPVEWGYGAALCGAFCILGGGLSGLLFRHGALQGVFFASVSVWVSLFIFGQTVLPHIENYAQQPVRWMALKIKEENTASTAKGGGRPTVALYKVNLPSVRFVSGVPYVVSPTAEAVFRKEKVGTLFVISRIDDAAELDAYTSPTAQKECFGGYCLTIQRP